MTYEKSEKQIIKHVFMFYDIGEGSDLFRFVANGFMGEVDSS